MKRPPIKNLLIYCVPIIFTGVAYYFMYLHDSHLMQHQFRYQNTMDSAAMYYSGYQLQVAKKFSDTTLPQLKKMGLVIACERRDVFTAVTVSGTVWKERSQFFKKNFLMELLIYSKVYDHYSSAKVIDDRTGRVYAEVSPPDQVRMYE